MRGAYDRRAGAGWLPQLGNLGLLHTPRCPLGQIYFARTSAESNRLPGGTRSAHLVLQTRRRAKHCCKAHTAELVNMNCDGPTSHWNYSWHDHCAGQPPPPWLPSPPPAPPSPTSPIQYSDVQIFIPEGTSPQQSTVCGKPISQWQQEGFLQTVSVKAAPALEEITRMAWALLDESIQR